MGEPIDGASLGRVGAMDRAKGALDSLVELAGPPPSEEPNAKDTRKMYEQHVLEEEDEEEEEEEEEDDEEKDEDQGGGRVSHDDIFKYYGYRWPEVVGLKAQKAKRIIGKGKPDIYFEVVSQNQMLTMSYATRRVRLIVDRSNCVVRTPHVG